MPKLSKEQIIERISHYKENYVDFIKEFGRIRVPGGIIKFNMFDYQEDLAFKLQNNDFNIILKARQLGISTIVGAYLGTHIIFNPQSDIIIIAINEDVAKELILKIKVFLEGLPKYVRPEILNPRNKESIDLANGSRVKALTSTSKSGRSFTASFLVLDECAFIENVDELWTSAYPTISNGGKAILLSCVTKDTFIYTDKGIKTINDFILNNNIGDYLIKDYNILGKNKLRTGNLFHNNGKVKTKIIKTSYTELEGSYNHKLWACKNGKYDWYRHDELSVGDWVSIQYNMNIWGNNDGCEDFNPIITNKQKNIFNPKIITKDIAYLLGLFLAEGSVYVNKEKSKYTFTISCGDDISNIFNKLNLSYYKNPDGIHYEISCKNFIEFLEYLRFDLSLKAKEKIIPSRLLEMSEENICAMMQGLFDGDGYARKDRNQIGIGLASKTMIEQIRIILLNLGIFTIYDEVESKPTKKVKVKSMQYRLSLNNYNSKIFFEKIGFNLERKQKIYERLKDNIIDNNLDSYDVIPFMEKYIKEMYLEYKKELKKKGLKIKDIKINNSIYQGYKTISRRRLLKFYEKIKNLISIESKEKLEKIISHNLRWTQITEIINSENETYDFSLPNNETDFWAHSVIYNGILGHNTPNGEGNLFHDIWTASENNDNEFTATKLYWWQMPGRDEKWKQRTLANMRYDMKRFEQEYECSFASSSKSVISLTKINEILKENEQNKVRVQPNFVSISGKRYDNNFFLYKFPVIDHKYLITVDTAEGLGEERDASAFIIQDLNTDEVIGEYADKELNEKQFAKVLLDICKSFNNAFVVVELKSTGKVVVNYLLEWKYKNVIWMDKRMSLFLDPYSKKSIPSAYQYDKANNIIPGFFTNAGNKVMYVGEMRNAVEENEITKIYTKKMLEQQKTFVNRGGSVTPKYGASGRNNDDIVVCFGIGVFIKKYIWKIIENNNILSQEILDFYSRKVQKMSDSDILTETTAFAPIYKMSEFKRKMNPYINPLSQQIGDTRYLLDNFKENKKEEKDVKNEQ